MTSTIHGLSLVCSLLLVVPAGAAPAQTAEQPASLQLDGPTVLTRVGLATRAERLGLVELYSIALYLAAPPTDRAQMASEQTAKALRIEVKYDTGLRPVVPIDWRRELVPSLNSAAIARLRETFAPLKAGDLVLIAYVPDRGTTVRVNKGIVVFEGSHDLMMAFLDHWLGQTPVSEEIKQALGGRS